MIDSYQFEPLEIIRVVARRVSHGGTAINLMMRTTTLTRRLGMCPSEIISPK